jgi:hypothetical protein
VLSLTPLKTASRFHGQLSRGSGGGEAAEKPGRCSHHLTTRGTFSSDAPNAYDIMPISLLIGRRKKRSPSCRRMQNRFWPRFKKFRSRATRGENDRVPPQLGQPHFSNSLLIAATRRFLTFAARASDSAAFLSALVLRPLRTHRSKAGLTFLYIYSSEILPFEPTMYHLTFHFHYFSHSTTFLSLFLIIDAALVNRPLISI